MAADRDRPRVSVIIPAYNEQGRIGATVGAARAIAGVREVIVVDDGSTDETADHARAAGAGVISARHGGKGAALRRGVAAAAEPVVLLLDADLGHSAARASALLAPVVEGRADMTIAVLPAAPRRPGFGLALGTARIGLWLLVGRWFAAPLSGQRGMTAALARAIPWARGFGAEVGATCDAAAMGARILEAPVEFEHPPTGRSLAGFAHRARQLTAVMATLTPRAFYPISPAAGLAPARRLAAAAIAWAMAAGVGWLLAPWAAAAAAAGGLAVALVVAALAINYRAGIMRANYLGRAIPAAGGVGFALGPLALWAWIASIVGPQRAWADVAAGALAGLPGLCALGAAVMCAVGLADDVYGSRQVSGLAGHFGSLLRGRITTGAVKAVAGGAVGLTVGWLLAREAGGAILNGAIIALSANLVNLLDVRPGRALKGFFLLAVVGVAADPYALWAVAPIGAVALAFAPVDLGGRAMMGDAGANALGAAAGIACAFALPLWGKAVLAAALAGIHLYSERRSLNDLIVRAPVLRWLDQLGRPRKEIF